MPRAIIGTLLTLLACHVAAAAQRIAVPSYFYPGPLWAELESGAPTAGLAIINPNSGPGPTTDPNYAAQVTHTRAAGMTVIAYVYTSYAARSAPAVEADIDAYYTQYPDLDGIFIDEVGSDCGLAPYYAGLDAYVKAKGGAGVTVLNPGNPVPECYATAGDILLTFEGSYAAYLGFALAGWESGYPDAKFWHLVYAASAAQMPSAISLSRSRHAGWVYVTDDVLANPWDTLPPYWSAEVAEVGGAAGGCFPMTGARVLFGGVGTPPGDDTLRIVAQVVLADSSHVDSAATGLRMRVRDTNGDVLDTTLPAGGSWRTSSSGTHSTFTGTIAPAGRVKATVKRRPMPSGSRYTLKVSAREGSYTVDPSALPVSIEIGLDPTASDGPCASATFDAGCRVSGGGAKLGCR